MATRGFDDTRESSQDRKITELSSLLGYLVQGACLYILDVGSDEIIAKYSRMKNMFRSLDDLERHVIG